jgi:hypothetical protein
MRRSAVVKTQYALSLCVFERKINASKTPFLKGKNFDH